MEKLLTPEEIANLLGVKLSTIYSWTHLGFIPHIKMGRLIRFREEEILKWINKLEKAGRNSRCPDIKLPH